MKTWESHRLQMQETPHVLEGGSKVGTKAFNCHAVCGRLCKAIRGPVSPGQLSETSLSRQEWRCPSVFARLSHSREQRTGSAVTARTRSGGFQSAEVGPLVRYSCCDWSSGRHTHSHCAPRAHIAGEEGRRK